MSDGIFIEAMVLLLDSFPCFFSEFETGTWNSSPFMASLGAHLHRLSDVCRIGGPKFSCLCKPTRTPVADVAADMKACFSVDTSDDSSDVHRK